MSTSRDPAELARLRAKLAYWSKREDVTPPEGAELADLFSTDIVMEFEITDPGDVRCGQTVRVPAFRTGAVAKLLDKSVQTIRLYEKSGVLPDAGVRTIVGQDRGRHKRGYTYDQFMTMFNLLPLMNFSDVRGLEYSPFSRELWRSWAKMPNQIQRARAKPASTRGRPRRGAE